MISAIILAAGQSTRMGSENKLLLPFGESTLIEHMVDVVCASRAGETLVVLGHEGDRLRRVLAEKPVTLVENPDYTEGMSTSIRAGLRCISPRSKGAMICLTDQPLLEPADLNRLIGALEAETETSAAGTGGGPEHGGANGKSIVVPIYQGQRGNPVLFAISHRNEVMAARGPVGGCRGIVKRYPGAVLSVEMENDHILHDIDTPEDYRALQAARAGHSGNMG